MSRVKGIPRLLSACISIELSSPLKWYYGDFIPSSTNRAFDTDVMRFLPVLDVGRGIQSHPPCVNVLQPLKGAPSLEALARILSDLSCTLANLLQHPFWASIGLTAVTMKFLCLPGAYGSIDVGSPIKIGSSS